MPPKQPAIRKRLHAACLRVKAGPAAFLLALALGAQLAHALLILALKPHAALASNLLQTAIPAISVGLCLFRARRSNTWPEKQLWILAAISFATWDAGQVVYLYNLVQHGTGNAGTADLLWLVFAFPLLVATAKPGRSLFLDPVAWLDTAQSAVLFAVLCVLVSPHRAILRAPVSYNVEDVAILLSVLLRFTGARDDEQRMFYRKMVGFAAAYAFCSWLGYWEEAHGLPVGTYADLLWSAPFTVASLLALSFHAPAERPRVAAGWRVSVPEHLHGATALGMAVMSMAGAAMIARYGVGAGLPLMAAAFLLFAARTSTREWQLQTTHARLQKSVLHDPLTSLPNTAHLRKELTARLQRSNHPDALAVGVLFLDLDRFKTINDALGHIFGDLLLVEVGARLRAAVGEDGFVARHGGDEFVLLLGLGSEEEGMAFAEALMETLRQPMTLEGRVLHITTSLGLAVSQPGCTADALLQDAGCAMYKAKTAGRNRGLSFAPKMVSTARHKLDLEADLRKALVSGEIEVHYQPIYALKGMELRGFEALARWRHPERGLVPPGEFIPIAEDTGLILELGRQVMQRACHQCQAWNKRFGVRLRVAVNVSVHQFADAGLMDSIVEALESSGLEPSLLRIEITESVLVNSFRQVEDVLMRARKLGIGICLDDFGTGYSSLSYLLRIPFDVVKIDRSFIRFLDRDRRRAEMVRMIMALGATLKKRIVAEGVETEGELAQLREMGCEMVQGFLLSKPLVTSAVETLLLSGIAVERRFSTSSAQASVWRTPGLDTSELRGWDRPLLEAAQQPALPG